MNEEGNEVVLIALPLGLFWISILQIVIFFRTLWPSTTDERAVSPKLKISDLKISGVTMLDNVF
jgi:hypothetical protein